MAIEKQRHMAKVGRLNHKMPVKIMMGMIHSKKAAEIASPTVFIIG